MTATRIAELEAQLAQKEEDYAELYSVYSDMSCSVQDLVSAQSQIQALLNNASEGIIVFDSNELVQSFNRAAEGIFSTAEISVLYQKVNFLFEVPDQYDSLIQYFRDFCACSSEKDILNNPLYAVDGNGKRVPLSISVSEVTSNNMIVFDDEGVVSEVDENDYDLFFCIFHDLTERIDNRNALLAHQHALEQANLFKTQLMSNVSHELLTPLNGIIPLTELLLESDVNGEQKQFVEVIKSSSEGLKKIVHAILKYSNLQKNAGNTQVQPCTLADFEIDIKSNYQSLSDEKGLTLLFRVGENVPPVLQLDRDRVADSLDRLLDNAIKFTRKGKVVVDIKMIDCGVNGNKLQFIVSDTGVGIEEKKLSTIFQSFVQGDGSKTRSFGGVGLGLAIVAQFVNDMDGEIWVTSDLGVGSVFGFELLYDEGDNSVEKLPVINEEIFSEIKSLLGEAMSDVVEDFVVQTSNGLKYLSDSSNWGNIEREKNVLNENRARSLQIGAVGLSKMCQNLESMVESTTDQQKADRYEELVFEFEQVKAELRLKLGE
jgi:signal transduction histidine kinase